MTIPDFIVHYSRSEPFQSISDVSRERLQEVLSQLDESNSWGLSRFSDAEYLPRRLKVEQKLRDAFIEKGGMPELDFPLYFFLGRNAGFEEHERNIGYKIELSHVPPHAICFTYGDSMFSMCENYRQQVGSAYASDLCSKVYRLEELEALFSAAKNAPQVLRIECQLWIRPTAEMFTRLDK